MVIFRRPEGKPGYHQAESVEDALRFVEMLRNQENVTDTRIFRMEEVPIEVRTVYKVELAGQPSDSPAHATHAAPAAPVAPSTPAAPASTASAPVPQPVPAVVANELANGDAAGLGPQEVFEPPVPVAAKGRRFRS
jgi:hypothetical protein